MPTSSGPPGPTPGPASKTDALQDRSPFPAPSVDIGTPPRIDDLTPEDIRAQIVARERDMKYHIEAIKHEVLGLGDDLIVGGRPLPDWIRGNRIASLAAAVGTGVLLGTLLGLRSRAKRRPDPDDGTDFVRARTALLLDEAAWKVALGMDSDEALRKTMQTTPVIYADRQPVSTPRSAVADTVDVALKSALGFLMKSAMDGVTQKLTGHDETFSAMSDATS